MNPIITRKDRYRTTAEITACDSHGATLLDGSVVPWSDLLWITYPDGSTVHRDAASGEFIFIRSRATADQNKWLDTPVANQPMVECTEADDVDAIALINQIDSEDARLAICGALTVAYSREEDKKRLWGKLSYEQKCLVIGNR